jgi:uncharacterized membrane protein
LSKKDENKTFIASLSEYFFDGLIVIVPPAITIFIVMWLWDLTESTLGSNINEYLGTNLPGIGLMAILFSILAIGFFTANNLAKKFIALGEILVDKIPVIKFIYSSAKQFSQAVLTSNTTFKHVVLVQYHQSWTLGFLMPNIPSPVREKLGVDYVCVFIPWSLNMTAGTNLFVRRQDIISVNMTSEDALQFILTAGTISTENLKK